MPKAETEALIFITGARLPSNKATLSMLNDKAPNALMYDSIALLSVKIRCHWQEVNTELLVGEHPLEGPPALLPLLLRVF